METSSYRIRTNINQDQVVRAKLTQDNNFLEILSLKINQEDTYKLHVSDYGIIVGRVLANDAFGIPNAKVSVFIPLTEEDSQRSEIINLYPYKTIHTVDSENRRYNLLPDESNDECYRVVGTFPNKRLVLDNDTEIEIFEKYWKYTTTTNQAGDYMIFGVPTGNQQIHVDIDLSDIGMLSQKPRDFIYKGYNITQFDNASQFKESTNLDNLSQLLSQTNSVHVYPFWGDTDMEEIAITRCDLQVQYKFEPTCVFMGSIVSDNYSNSIGDKCNPSKYCGYNRNLIAGEGTIEMIRKTPDGLIEEHQIQGNRLIDSDGVWCYQIPMNLDFVGTDEFGNIVPTDNPNKGIPTRTSVRFRVSMQESDSDGISRHRAKYLIPNIHPLVADETTPMIASGSKFNQCFEFGSATPNEYFRDLYWNKVYSVKNYIPRLQTNKSASNKKYSAIRTVNVAEGKNPFPFNNGRIQLFFSYRLICMLMEIMAAIACAVNSVLTAFGRIGDLLKPIGANTKLFAWIGKALSSPFYWIQKALCLPVKCISFYGLSETDEVTEYVPCCAGGKTCQPKCKEDGCSFTSDYSDLVDTIQQSLSQEYDTVNLDFYNDWVNGCLYMPLWFWKKTKKRTFLWGLIKLKGKNRFCDCDTNQKRLRVLRGCAIKYNKNYNLVTPEKPKKEDVHKYAASTQPKHGIIKEVENKAGLKIYYYTPGIPTSNTYHDENGKVDYVVLYSTDIILLGSLNECDLDNLPRPYLNLPSTTANIPFITTLTKPLDDDDDGDSGEVEVTGMDWMRDPVRGLFMDLKCMKAMTRPKTCVNMYRLSELGVSLDSQYEDVNATSAKPQLLSYTNNKPADGLITRFEIMDHETRAMFASLNHNGLTEKIYNPNTGYDTYKLKYCYPVDFDGHLAKHAPVYTQKFDVRTFDNKDENYIDYRFGRMNNHNPLKFYSSDYNFPVFNNSFYFYFGLNEGSTAIDKFNNLFYSTCFRNYKYPFSVSYQTSSASWCDIAKGGIEPEFAAISVNVSNIKLPYSYILYNEQGEEVISENGLNVKEFKLGYKMSGPNEYEKIQGTENFQKSTELYYTQTGYPMIPSKTLDNGVYTLDIIDANSKVMSSTFTISPLPIDAEINGYSLGIKYYDGIEKSKICDGFSGRIEISELTIDGKSYTNLSASGGNGIYDISSNNIVHAKLTLEYLGSEEVNDPSISTFDDCLCSHVDDNGIVQFFIWVPGSYRVTVEQYCGGVVNDNIASETIKIKNGSPFKSYINNTPIEFIPELSKVEYFARNNASFWETIYKTENYDFFEDINNKKWEEYVNLTYNIETDDDGNEISTLSDESKLDIIAFKLNSILGLTQASYITDSYKSVSISMKTTGGVQPILFNGVYPNYDEFNGSDYLTEVLHDNEGSVTVNASAPNVVYDNYTEWDINGNYPRVIGNAFPSNLNKLLPGAGSGTSSSPQGNYFAAFTNNGKPKYLALPTKSKPIGALTNSIIQNSYNTNSNNYSKVLTVDRRIDYELLYVPNNGNLLTGTIYNGLKMAYDNVAIPYNTIGNNLEYKIDYDEGTITNGNPSRYSFYDANLKVNANFLDLTNTLTATTKDENIHFEERIASNDGDLSKIVLSITNCEIPSEALIEYDYNENGEVASTRIDAIVEEGEEVVLELDQVSPIVTKPLHDKLEDYITINATAESMDEIINVLLLGTLANVALKYEGGNLNQKPFNGNTFFTNLKFGFKTSRTDSEHTTLTYLPFYKVNDDLNDITSVTDIKSLSSFLSSKTKLNFGNITNDEKSGYAEKSIINAPLKTRIDIYTQYQVNSLSYICDAEDSDIIIFDDDSFAKSLTYNVLDGANNEIRHISVYCVREYINSMNNNLMRNTLALYRKTYEIGSLTASNWNLDNQHLNFTVGGQSGKDFQISRAIISIDIGSTNAGPYECSLSGNTITCNFSQVQEVITDNGGTVYCYIQLDDGFVYEIECGKITREDKPLSKEEIDAMIKEELDKLKQELEKDEENNNSSGETTNP